MISNIRENYGWTSQYWNELYKKGWRIVKSKGDPKKVIVQDEKDNFCVSAKDRIDILTALIQDFVLGG